MKMAVAAIVFLLSSAAHAEPSIDEKREAAQLGLTEFCHTMKKPPPSTEVLEFLAKQEDPMFKLRMMPWLVWLDDVLTKYKERCGET